MRVKITGNKDWKWQRNADVHLLLRLWSYQLMMIEYWLLNMKDIITLEGAQYFEEHSFVGHLSQEKISILIGMSKGNNKSKEILNILK